MASNNLTPKAWHHSHGQCPPVLGITLTRPWAWAFFRGSDSERKDVENRSDKFPLVPPGTWLALHNAQGWSSEDEAFIKGLLPASRNLRPADCPPGVITGVVRVREARKAAVRGVAPASSSPWHFRTDTAIWLDPERYLLPAPVPWPCGWFNAWHLPDKALASVLEQLQKLGVSI